MMDYSFDLHGWMVILGYPDTEVSMGSVAFAHGTNTLEINEQSIVHPITRVFTSIEAEGDSGCGGSGGMPCVRAEVVQDRTFRLTAYVPGNSAIVHWIAITLTP
jgi:hypothetical protein